MKKKDLISEDDIELFLVKYSGLVKNFIDIFEKKERNLANKALNYYFSKKVKKSIFLHRYNYRFAYILPIILIIIMIPLLYFNSDTFINNEFKNNGKLHFDLVLFSNDVTNFNLVKTIFDEPDLNYNNSTFNDRIEFFESSNFKTVFDF